MEKPYKPYSGYLMLLVLLGVIALFVYGLITQNYLLLIGAILVFILVASGFFFINPNASRVMTLFGKYKGTVKENGFFWVNPFFTKRNISLRARNFESERVKVNDKRGNPIQISVITVWRVEETHKAAFEVDDYTSFVKLQSDAAVRNLAGQYCYDNFDDEQKEITLRSGLQEINHALEHALSERLGIAGIEVMEARIGYLAYAEEIAGAMLKRQQAEAIVAARFKIVEGAVSMVEMALKDLSDKNIIELDDERKAAMVSNLMIVLCGDKDVTPVINTGSLYQ
jgi:regulator of protease activity HflC (stomatin/prohibitin superfamily)